MSRHLRLLSGSMPDSPAAALPQHPLLLGAAAPSDATAGALVARLALAPIGLCVYSVDAPEP